MKNLMPLLFCLLIFACSSSNNSSNDKLIEELVEAGVLGSCGSVQTGCDGNCPDGQYCEEFQNGWCFCVRSNEVSADSVIINESMLAFNDCQCTNNGIAYEIGDYLCLDGTVNRCIYEPTSESCTWYSWGVDCNESMDTYYASLKTFEDDERKTSSIRVTNQDPMVDSREITISFDQTVSVYEYKHGPCSWSNTLFKRKSDGKVFKCSQGGGSCKLTKGTYIHYFTYSCRQSPTNRMYTMTSTVGYD